jgi:hypothetical protein
MKDVLHRLLPVLVWFPMSATAVRSDVITGASVAINERFA